MIEEAYVSFEVAKLLNGKGFKEATIGYYNSIAEIPERVKFFDSPISIFDSDGLVGCIQAPTQQMAMAWLREVYGIYIVLFHTNKSGWWYNISDMTDSCVYYSSEKTKLSYEEAVEAAIKYCLENLI